MSRVVQMVECRPSCAAAPAHLLLSAGPRHNPVCLLVATWSVLFCLLVHDTTQSCDVMFASRDLVCVLSLISECNHIEKQTKAYFRVGHVLLLLFGASRASRQCDGQCGNLFKSNGLVTIINTNTKVIHPVNPPHPPERVLIFIAFPSTMYC